MFVSIAAVESVFGRPANQLIRPPGAARSSAADVRLERGGGDDDHIEAASAGVRSRGLG